jgi:hypothetical protein
MQIIANISFFSRDKNGVEIKQTYKSGVAMAFSIREDMFNYGIMLFIDKMQVISGEENIHAKIIFAREDLVSPYLKEGLNFSFGSMLSSFGEGFILKILTSPFCTDLYCQNTKYYEE